MTLYDILKSSEDGKEIAEAAADQVNSFNRQTRELNKILEDHKTKGIFQKMSVAYIKSLATCLDSGCYDGRNEYSCNVAKLVTGYAGFHSAMGITKWDGSVYNLSSIKQWERVHGKPVPVEGAFAFYMSGQHRTLQQSFAELAFRCINDMLCESGDKGLDRYMQQNGLCAEWERTPMV